MAITKFNAFFTASIIVFSAAAVADEEQLKKLHQWAESDAQLIVNDPLIIEAIKSQNKKHAALNQAEIDSKDKQWRVEAKVGNGPLVDEVASNALSEHLANIQDNQENGLFTEIFVMDNLGLNVGVSALTSDYWQGDEAKFQETFGKGVDSVHISDIEFDDSANSFQAQVSLTISDSGTPIGAVTFGIDVDELQ